MIEGSYDIAVIGAGATGLEIANALKKSSLKFILIERGAGSFTLDQPQFESIGKKIRSGALKNKADAEKNLARYIGFGGTYNIWGRIWKTLAPKDFEKWPITYDELLPYYREVAKVHNVEEVLENPNLQCKVQKGFETSFKEFEQNTFLEHAVVGLTIDHNRVTGVRLDNQQEIKADIVILAAGTIESTRLLLNQPEFKHPLLGKYLMDHPKGYCGRLIPTEKAMSLLPKVTNHKEFKTGLTLDGTPHHSVLFKKVRDSLAMRFHLEQLPNIESRITLSDKHDQLGLPIPVLDWRLTDQDTEFFRKFFFKMKAYLENDGYGSVVYDEKEIDLDHFTDASHQMGTIRMGDSPADAIVDSNLKVFDIDNLYVVSNAVFPASGNANPTMTLLALARRLIHFLS